MAATIDNQAISTKAFEQITTFHDSTQPITNDTFPHQRNLFSDPKHRITTSDPLHHDIDTILARPFFAGEALLSVSNTPGQKIIDLVPEELLGLNPQYERKVDFQKYVDTEIIIELRLNQQPAQQGLFAVTSLPGWKYRQDDYNSVFGTIDDGVNVDLRLATSYAYELCDIKTNNSIFIKPKYYAPYPSYDATTGEGTWGRVIAYVIQPLQDISASGTVSISILVHARSLKVKMPTSIPTIYSTGTSLSQKILNLTNRGVKLFTNLTMIKSEESTSEGTLHAGNFIPMQTPYMPMIYQQAPQLVRPRKSRIPVPVKATPPKEVANSKVLAEKEQKERKAIIDDSSYGDLAKGMMHKVGDFIYDKAIEPVSKMVLSWFGMCHEQLSGTIQIHKQHFLPNVNNYDGTSDAHIFGLDTDNHINRIDLLSDETTTFEYMCNRYIWFNSVTWNSADPPTTLLTINLYPFESFSTSTSNTSALALFSKVCNQFQYVNADMEIKIVPVCTSLHSGRYVVAFDPKTVNTTAPTLNLVYKEVFDLKPERSHETFNVDFVQNALFLTRPFRFVFGESSPLDINSLGILQINSYTALKVMNVAPPTINLHIFLRLKNVKLGAPVSTLYFPSYPNAPQIPPFGLLAPYTIITEGTLHAGGEEILPENDVEEKTIPNVVDSSGFLNYPSTSAPVDILDDVVGEQIHSPLALMQRFGNIGYFPNDQLIPANNIFIINPWTTIALTPQASSVGAKSALLPYPHCLDSLDVWLNDFVSWAGSMEINIQIPNVKIEDRFRVFLIDPTFYPTITLEGPRLGYLPIEEASRFEFGTHNFLEYNGLEGNCTIRVPFYSARALCISSANKQDYFKSFINQPQFAIGILPMNPASEWTIPAGTTIRRRFGNDASLGPLAGTRPMSIHILRSLPTDN